MTKVRERFVCLAVALLACLLLSPTWAWGNDPEIDQFFAKANKTVVTFLGYAGAEYENERRVRRIVRNTLSKYDPATTLVNVGVPTEGIALAHHIAKEMGFETTAILSELARFTFKESLVTSVDHWFYVKDTTWGGYLPKKKDYAPVTKAIVKHSDVIVCFGGNDITADELYLAVSKGKDVRYYPADMGHGRAIDRAKREGWDVPKNFAGSAYKKLLALKHTRNPRNLRIIDMFSQKELKNKGEVLEVAKSFKARVLMLGNGKNGQYKSIQKVLKDVDKLAAELNRVHGRGNWLAIFGGDEFDPDQPDIAHVLKHLKEKHGAKILAIQADVTKQSGGVDRHIDFVHYVETSYSKPPGKNGGDIKNVIWGGVEHGTPRGPTRVYLGDEFVKGENRLLTKVVSVGGGPVALQEMVYAYSHGVEIGHVSAAVKYPHPDGPYDAVKAWSEREILDMMLTCLWSVN